MIDNSYLLGLFGGTPLASTSGASALLAAQKRKQPTPPWDAKAVTPSASSMVRSALAGRKFIDESAAKLDVKDAGIDYRKLFALHQGLETLNELVNRASVKGVAASEMSLLAKRFESGLSEVSSYLSSAQFNDVRLVQGTVASTSKSTGGVPRGSAVSITGPIHEGSVDEAVEAFQGDVRFTIKVRRTNDTVEVPIDLAGMGAQERTLNNVTKFINDQLEARDLGTQIGRERIKAEPRTTTVNGKTVTLPPGPDQWALAVRGVTGEHITFVPEEKADAVYVVQGAGTKGGHQVLKFQTDIGDDLPDAAAKPGETHWVEDRLSQTNLPEGVSAVRASATGPDGSVWMVVDLKAGVDAQPIKGTSDVALMKLDSAGRVVMTRAIGAASEASGYAIAVDPNGRVAVAGSVTGALEPGKAGDAPGVADSFVTVFDAEGLEQWTQRRGARAADMATSVSFGSDGRVYVAGKAQSNMTGGVGVGGWDGYVQGFQEVQEHKYAPLKGEPIGVDQFGTTGSDDVQAMVVDGGNLYTAGVEDGRMVVRRFQLDAEGRQTLVGTRDMGVASGDIAGIAVSGGRIVLSGTTRNADLDVGNVSSAHSGGTDAFVAVMASDLSEGQDQLIYYGGEGDDTAADVKVSGDGVWITGVSDRELAADDKKPTKAYLARIDLATGDVNYERTWEGPSGQAKPATLAVANGGASVLDRLGLPQGEIDQSDSKTLTAATSLRVGDRFYISPAGGGRSVAVTIEARDTLQSLARKIELASNMKLRVTVGSGTAENPLQGDPLAALSQGFQKMTITARDGSPGAVFTAGEPGRDALAGLGLSAGFVGPTKGEKDVKAFGLDLPRTLSLSTEADRKAAGERLQAAMTAVRNAYKALAPKTPGQNITGQAPAYLTAQLANYQAALQRLTGGY